jgi:predicted nucleic acid-binding protein
MNGKFVLDSNRVIDLVDDKEGAGLLREKLKDVKRYISVVSRVEALASPKLSPEDDKIIRNFLKTFKVIPLNRKVEKNAIMLRRKTGLKLPDAIIAATALSLGADIISRDEHLLKLKVPGLRVVETL